MLAEALAEIPGIEIDLDKVQTNLIRLDISGLGMNGNELAEKLKKKNIIMNGSRDGHIRFATHYYIEKEDVEKLIEVMKSMAKE